MLLARMSSSQTEGEKVVQVIPIEHSVFLLKRIRQILALFIVALVLSGLTAFPLQWELGLLASLCQMLGVEGTSLGRWIFHVKQGLDESYARYPFIAYGTDWLAFAHLIIGVLFWGAIKDPVRNKWVVQFGLIACVGVIPLALICGSIREIPFFWRLIDCSFGIFGFIPLWFARRLIIQLEAGHASGLPA